MSFPTPFHLQNYEAIEKLYQIGSVEGKLNYSSLHFSCFLLLPLALPLQISHHSCRRKRKDVINLVMSGKRVAQTVIEPLKRDPSNHLVHCDTLRL